MKHYLKKCPRISRYVLLGFATILAATSLTGCLHRKKTTYQAYMQNILDVNYKGQFDQYIDDNDGSRDNAESMYSDTIDYLSEQLINHYSLANAGSDDAQAKVKDIFKNTSKEIYSQAKYEVSQAYKNGSDYYVDVTVYPMDILNQAFTDVFAYIENTNKKITSGEFNNTTKEDYQVMIAQGVSDILTSKTPDMEYRSPVVVSVKINDDGDYYCAESSGLSQVDASMLAIEGSSGSADATEESEGSEASEKSSEEDK